MLKTVLILLIVCQSFGLLAQVRDTAKKDTVIKPFKVNSILLNEVNIKAFRNYKLDSINLRKDFAKTFAHKGPSMLSVFSDRNATMKRDYSPFQQSTNTLLGVDVLRALSFIGKNKNSTTKLKKMLLNDEEDNFVKTKFSREKVSSMTRLEGDSLLMFMNRYRPSAYTVKEMTDYEILLYIKKSYALFKKKD